MNKHPVIGICGAYHTEEETVLIKETYTNAILRWGGLPVVLPEVTDKETIERYLDVIDGLLLSGGGDIEASIFGEEKLPESGEPNLKRDAFELSITPLAVERQMPVFGICRGMQVLNVALGGTIYQDIPVQLGIPCEKHRQEKPYSAPYHEVLLERNGLFASIVGSDSVMTNSMHHQSLKDIAESLVVEGRTADGVIEAVSSRENEGVFGVQFHPEYLQENDPALAGLFRHFIVKAAEYRLKKK